MMCRQIRDSSCVDTSPSPSQPLNSYILSSTDNVTLLSLTSLALLRNGWSPCTTITTQRPVATRLGLAGPFSS